MDHRLVTLRVLAAGKLREPKNLSDMIIFPGILRNISPIPPPSATSFVDIDKDIVLPLLQPVISSVSLFDISNSVQELVQREVSRPRTMLI